jgi:hypothetical protein
MANEEDKKKKRRKKVPTKGYIEQINDIVMQEYGEIPVKLTLLIRKTAHDMIMLDRISEDLYNENNLIMFDAFNVTGTQKMPINPLVPYFEKISGRVTDDLYNLGLTARKQAEKSKDPGKVDDEDPMKKFYQDARK